MMSELSLSYFRNLLITILVPVVLLSTQPYYSQNGDRRRKFNRISPGGRLIDPIFGLTTNQCGFVFSDRLSAIVQSETIVIGKIIFINGSKEEVKINITDVLRHNKSCPNKNLNEKDSLNQTEVIINLSKVAKERNQSGTKVCVRAQKFLREKGVFIFFLHNEIKPAEVEQTTGRRLSFIRNNKLRATPLRHFTAIWPAIPIQSKRRDTISDIIHSTICPNGDFTGICLLFSFQISEIYYIF